MRVLVIDDNPDDRQLVLHELRSLYPDAESVECADLAEFHHALDAAQPDLVISDFDLRWSNGRDVLSEVKQRNPECPVIMFTGSGDEMTAVDLMKAGLDDYVVKSPRQLARLRASIGVVIEAASMRTTLSRREAQLAAALSRSDLLVQELHHRVKNNLQTATSLLRLSARRSDANTAKILEDLAGRMNTLGLIQTRLYNVGNFDRVDFAAVLAEIVEAVTKTYARDNLVLERTIDGPLELGLERAEPLGLLCYEILLNSLKHAWPGDRAGRLTVEMTTLGCPVVRFADDGIGFDSKRIAPGIGSRLLRALAAQAKVDVQMITAAGFGTTAIIRFVE